MADQQSFTVELQVTIQEVRKCGDNDTPEVIGKPYETTMERNQKFEVVFQRWHKNHEHRVPLTEMEFFYYSLGGPNPVPTNFGPGPINKATMVKPNDTPESLKIMEPKLRLYVRRNRNDADIQ